MLQARTNQRMINLKSFNKMELEAKKIKMEKIIKVTIKVKNSRKVESGAKKSFQM